MLTVEAVAAYLAAQGITALIAPGYDFVEQPDRVVYLTSTGGPGEHRERTFEQLTVQARCRGAQNDPADAEELAQDVDDAFMGPEYPVLIGGRHVPSIAQAGGAPAVIDRDDARRYITSASYVIDVARVTV